MQLLSTVIPGGHDHLPVHSLIATIDKEREATNTGNTADIREARKYRYWQLKNLFALQHPYATTVSDILDKNGLLDEGQPDAVTVSEKLSSNGLFEAREELLNLADTIQNEIRKIVEAGSTVYKEGAAGEETRGGENPRKAA